MESARPTPQQLRLLHALRDAGARFLLIGGWAVRAHGHDRKALYVHLWVRGGAGNAARVVQALASLGTPAPSASAGRLPSRVAWPAEGPEKAADLLDALGDMDFDACAARAVTLCFDGADVPVLGLADTLRSKEIAAEAAATPALRERDLADIAALKQLHGLA